MLSIFNRFRARALYILNSKVHYNLTDIFYSNKNKAKKETNTIKIISKNYHTDTRIIKKRSFKLSWI